jgi:hypothetical protein
MQLDSVFFLKPKDIQFGTDTLTYYLPITPAKFVAAIPNMFHGK